MKKDIKIVIERDGKHLLKLKYMKGDKGHKFSDGYGNGGFFVMWERATDELIIDIEWLEYVLEHKQ